MDYRIQITEMNDNHIIRDKRKELGILCYKAPELPVKQYNAIKVDLVCLFLGSPFQAIDLPVPVPAPDCFDYYKFVVQF